MAQRHNLAIFLAVVIAIPGCIPPQTGATREVTMDPGALVRRQAGQSRHGADARPVLQTELQQDLQRFASQYTGRIAEALHELTEVDDPKLRAVATRSLLVYHAAALDIATGPLPEINLLDMLVYVLLSRAVVERYWIPEVYHLQGRPLAKAFAQSEADLWRIADKVLTQPQQQELRELAGAWLAQHPERIAVESLRFEDFSAWAGELTAKHADTARGLRGRVEQMTQAADEALLLGERGMFLVHRLPFLLRLQARLGAQEVTSDALAQLQNGEWLNEQVGHLRPMLRDLVHITETSEVALDKAQDLVTTLKPTLEFVTASEEAGVAEPRPGQSDGFALCCEPSGGQRADHPAGDPRGRSGGSRKDLVGPRETHRPHGATLAWLLACHRRGLATVFLGRVQPRQGPQERPWLRDATEYRSLIRLAPGSGPGPGPIVARHMYTSLAGAGLWWHLYGREEKFVTSLRIA
jgi:hypothetical protein